ncbi:MAG: magnesium transporter CorA family protein [Aureispira sp.]|nr:magnesium transporter CorA family protein [Aureispira sp.]
MVRYFEKEQEQLVELKKRKDGCWINIAPPFNVVEIETLSEGLTIPMDFLTDPLDIDERTRFEVEGDAKLIVVNTPVLNDNTTEERSLYITVPIGIIVTPENILTISSYENSVIQKFIEQKIRNFNPKDVAMFILQILEQNVYAYLRCLKDINVRRNVIEQEVYESSQNKDLRSLLSLEKSLTYFVTALSSNAILKNKIDRMDFLGTKNNFDMADLLEDIIIDNNQAQEMAHIYSTILGNTMDALASMISNKLNAVMQRLTLITIILMVPTLVASFYGMNVNLPFEKNPYAFWGLTGFAIVFSTFLVIFFRTKKLF